MANATYTVDLDGTMNITHKTCGRTQIVAPLEVDEEGFAYFGSSADFCLACEDEGKPAGFQFGQEVTA
jgi:hypothetical protein